ncbi:MAG: ATP-binding cassette domain-containing protein [Spirochaetes bacterium]|nr:ATP-binding cassette domain-containing protein [Spirochaetota bacterium]
MTAIRVRELRKQYRVSEREAGLWSSVKSLVRRKTRTVSAVDGISFDIAPGEIVGFLGPNGAGKTTTLKMLSGLLHPSSGEIEVLGQVPWKRHADFLGRMSLVMGQRNQLVWDIPAVETFELNRAIYRIPMAQYRETLDELVDLLDLKAVMGAPVRNLSLGERMKCELTAALLHRPKVVFLDEPTIGLDVTMQRRLRDFISQYRRVHGATVLLTSHYMADVEALCRRVIVIHRGRLLFDGDLGALVGRFAAHKLISIHLATPCAGLAQYGELVSDEEGHVTLRVPKAETPRVTARLLAELPITDLTVEDPPIDEVISRVFTEGAV